MERWTFGDFVLDLDRHERVRAGTPVSLSPKAFQLLGILVETHPRALSKTELQDRLWAGTFVVERNLTNLVSEIREAGGVETLPARMRWISTPSARASDPRDPVGATAAAIRAALPEFHEWRFDTGDAAARFLSFAGERLKGLEAMLPPGFAEGRPGAFLRSSRGLVRVRADGAVQSVYELLQESPDARTFGMAMQQVQISDVIDLTWMVAGVLELRAVEELVARVAGVVMPAADLRFSLYDEPRYRSALQMYEANGSARLASGGVLAEWPGRPGGVDAAHVRLFLEPWAEVRSCKAVTFDRIPRRG